MHFNQHDEDDAKYVTSEPKIGQTFVWPFMIQVRCTTIFHPNLSIILIEKVSFHFLFIFVLIFVGKKNAMENPSCTTTPPETILSLLWTAVAVFGIVYAILGYRCLRAIGFLSGLAAGTSIILWLQSQEIEILGHQADSGLFIICICI